MGVFDLNDKSPIQVEKIMGSNIYYIDNFYKKPDTIVKFLNTVPATIHDPEKDAGFKSFNGVHFPTRFNDYKNNFWHPHTDTGYTALIYFNKNDSECGTNLYRNTSPDTENNVGEHVVPWRSKSKWKIIKTLKPKFNRCVLFDGDFFPHGMHIPNDKYFKDEYRLNQVVFFQ